MNTIDVSEHPCLFHERAEADGAPTPPCGPIWYQFTAHDHTVGGCSRFINDEHGPRYEPFAGPMTGRIDVDHDTGQITLVLTDVNHVDVAAVAFFEKPV